MNATEARAIADQRNEELATIAHDEMVAYAEATIYPSISTLAKNGKYRTDILLPKPAERKWQAPELKELLNADGYQVDYDKRRYCLTIMW
jgi:hypothetical protein